MIKVFAKVKSLKNMMKTNKKRVFCTQIAIRFIHQLQLRSELSMQRSLLSRKGIGTLEVVIIIAVLISVALIFRQALMSYATRLIESVFGDQSTISDLFVDHDVP